MSRKLLIVFLTLLVMIPTLSLGVQAQQEEATITFAMPGLLIDIVKDPILAGFAETHPHIRVEFVASDGPGVYNASGDIESYLDGLETYAAEADVLLFSSSQLSPEATRAGYLLDINPLIGIDTRFPQDDFYPSLLNSYRWDGGTWGLPLAGDAMLVLYKPEVFDRVGLAYPNEAWTLADLENAITVLSQSEGDSAYMNLIPDEILLLSLAGVSVADDTVIPMAPNFDSPALQTLLTDWVEIAETGAFEFSLNAFSINSPLIVGQGLLLATPQFSEYSIASIPGGRSAVNFTGVSISSGTRYPEAAYEFAKFLTTSPNLSSSIFGAVPARQSLVGVSGDDLFSQALSAPDYLHAEMELLLASAYTVPQQHFSSYLTAAVSQMRNEGIDAQTALQEQEVKALANLQAADDRRETVSVAVATPIPQFTGEGIVINFGIQSILPQIANQAQWNTLAENFAANDPEVGQVVINVATSLTGSDLNKITTDYDCFYLPNNVVQTANLSLLRSLDPLIASDFNFDVNDLSGNALAQVQRDNQTWAIPLTIQPQNLWFNVDMLNRAGAQLPHENWTVSDFETVLRTLKITDEDPTPLSTRDYDNAHLLVLIAAYGGLPIDYSTNPSTINFTDPATVEAIQQVLDLAKNDYIEYTSMLDATAAAMAVLDQTTDPPMYIQQLNDLSLFILNMSESDTVSYQPALLPAGSQYSPLSYDIGAGYVSANTPAIDACYRFLTYVSQESATLFDRMMPVRRSLLSEVATTQGQETADLYAQIDRRMQQHNAVFIPTAMQATTDMSTAGSTLVSTWLNQAFDAYVLNDEDLTTALEDAQTLAIAYQQCTANIAPYDPLVNENTTTYLNQFIDCAVQVDPTMAAYLGTS